jgi:RNA polymerase sigma factor (sigma-70 family)
LSAGSFSKGSSMAQSCGRSTGFQSLSSKARELAAPKAARSSGNCRPRRCRSRSLWRIVGVAEVEAPAEIEQQALAGELLQIEDLLPSPDAGPEALYVRQALLEAVEFALAELPAEQREVFVAHELEGYSFKELSAESGISVNTLLARKHYAVLHLRRRLQSIHDEFAKK